MPPRICIIGSLNIDFTTTTARFPGPGETLTAKSLYINAGGKGANQAVACGRASFTSKAHQDVEVEMVGAVGANDPYYASLLKPTLQESGVACAGITEVTGAQTGTATIIVDEGSGGENRILVVPGANHGGMGDVEDVLARAMREPLPEVIVMQGEIPKATVLSILRRSQQLEHRCHVVFNPAPVFSDGIPKECFKGLGVLVVNETELWQLTQTLDSRTRTLFKEDQDLDRARLDQYARCYHDLGVATLIVTLGAKGVYYSVDAGNQELVEGVKVDQVVDTTAAGDTFVGYFAAAFARWSNCEASIDGPFDIHKAIQTANEAAAKCVQRSGAMQSIPWGYE
jgi:ribokinase